MAATVVARPVPTVRPAAGSAGVTRNIRRVSQTRYRVILALLGVAFAAVVVGAVLVTPSGRAPDLPDALGSYSPVDGATVLRQTRLVVDLAPDYDIDLVVDGAAIPDSELDVISETGRFTWEPGPGKTFEEWTPGFHAIEVTWDRITGLPDPGSLRWRFRVQ